MPASEMTHQAIFGKCDFGEERSYKATAERSKTSCPRNLTRDASKRRHEAAPKILAFRKSLRNFPWGSNFSAKATKSGNLSYSVRSCAGGIQKSLPQWGRERNGTSCFSITGSNWLTAGQSGFQVK